VRTIADERDYPLWRAIGLVLEGVTVALLGDASGGLAVVERGIESYENASAPPIFWPQVLSLEARACAASGRRAEALAAVDQALEIAGADNAFDRAPLELLAGDLLVADGEAEGGELRLRAAIVDGQRIGARMIELQALTRLVRLGRPGAVDAADALRQLLDELTEGADQPDVVEARAAVGLDAVAAPAG
jgi:hypothetical protein